MAGGLPTDDSFALVAENAPAMLWRGDANGRCIYLNKAQREFWGVSLDKLAEFSWSWTLLEEDSDKVYGPFTVGMQAQKPFQCEARYRRADGAIRILQTRAEPCFDAEGAFSGMVGVNLDVTDERRAETELAENEARLRALADNLPNAMIYQITRSADGAQRFSFVSSQCKALLGVEPEAALADPLVLYNLIAPEFRDAFAAAEQQAVEALTTFDVETKMQRADGVVRWFRLTSAPRPQANGDVIWDGVQVDITDTKQAEERRRLLMNEMSHRIKNTLATVNSIAAQTGRNAASYAEFSTVFQARLQALAKSHDLLMRDAQDKAELRDILQAELGPYSAEDGAGRSLTLEGEPVVLSGRAAISLALVVHELATNAAKYGAYAANGAIAISWCSNGGDGPVTLAWRERGGPPVAPPARTGFGSRLIQGVVRGELSGEIDMRYAPQGFEADMSFRVVPGAASF